MTYSISDLSKKFDLPASTIRYYDKKKGAPGYPLFHLSLSTPGGQQIY
jgi:hypothetical protein